MSITRSQIARQLMAEGGAPRQGYFFGKLVRKVKDDLIPNELKNPLGVAAALTAANFAPKIIPGIDLGGENQTLLQRFLPSVSDALGTARETVGDIITSDTTKDIVLGKKESDKRSGGILGALLSPTGLSLGAGLLAGALTKDEDDPLYTGQSVGLNLRDIRKLANITDPRTGSAIGLNFLPETRFRQFTPEQMAETYAATEPVEFTEQRESADTGGRIGFDDGGENLASDPNYKGWVKVYEKNPDLAEMNDNHSRYLRFYNSQSKSGGGLMNLGGNEMDLRGGGFVPIGVREKADDVPARLSKNEFVFTADAVRAAGGGSVDRGADLMYKTMKQLENKVA